MPLFYKPGTYRIPTLQIGDEVFIKNVEVSVFSERPFPRHQIIVSFMGSAGKEPDASGKINEPTQKDKELGHLVGRVVAANGAILSNGAVYGKPYFPIRGAQLSRAYTLGISPFPNRVAHEKTNPIKHFDLIVYVGKDFRLYYPRANFTFRDWFNTLPSDVVISSGGVIGTPDEVMHVLEQGGVYIAIRGSGGATDLIVEGIEKEVLKKDTGGRIIIADYTPQSLEWAINEGVAEAKTRWMKEGRTANRFSYIVDELEKVMGIK